MVKQLEKLFERYLLDVDQIPEEVFGVPAHIEIDRRETLIEAVRVEIQAARCEALEECLAIAEEYPETPEVARDIRALVEEE